MGRELSEELALNSSELRLSEASLSPLLMELLSSQLRDRRERLAVKTEATASNKVPIMKAGWLYSSIQTGQKGKSLGVSPGFAGNAKSDLNFLVIWCCSFIKGRDYTGNSTQHSVITYVGKEQVKEKIHVLDIH